MAPVSGNHAALTAMDAPLRGVALVTFALQWPKLPGTHGTLRVKRDAAGVPDSRPAVPPETVHRHNREP